MAENKASGAFSLNVRYVAAKTYREDVLRFQVIREWQEGTALVSQTACLCHWREDAEAIAAALNVQRVGGL